MASVFRWCFAWAKSWATSWLPFPKTIYMLLNSRARQPSTYVECCQGAIRLGLKSSHIPFRYDEDSKSISLKPQSRFLTDLHFILHIIWCLQESGLGLYWFYTTARDAGQDATEDQELVWKNLVMFYYVCISGGSIPIIWLVRKRADALKPLITAPFLMEQRCIEGGAKGYAVVYLLGLVTFAFANCFSMPLVYFTTSILRPCLPFMLVSQLNTNCPAWDSPGTVGVGTRILVGFYEFYAWMFLTSIYSTIAWIIFVYPGSACTQKIRSILRLAYSYDLSNLQP